MDPVSALRVVVADDHPIWRSGVRADLGDAFEVVAEAANAREAVALIAEHLPDVCCAICTCPKVEASALLVNAARRPPW